MTDRPYNAGNRKDVRSAEKAVIAYETVEREVIAGIMSVKNGRWWMFEILARCQAYADPFTPDPYVHSYHSGRKALGTELHLAIMAYAPQSYALMIEEANVRSLTESVRRSAAELDTTDLWDGTDDHRDPTDDRPAN